METSMLGVVRVALCVALGAVTAPAGAQSNYPDRPIRLIIPLAAASAVDAAARILTQKMSTNMGQSFIIENTPGASGQIGADRVAKAAPDGYTLGGFNDSIMVMLPNIQAHLPWDTIKDFEPISLVATIEWGLVASSETPYNDVAGLIKAAKATPGKINYGSGGIGSPQHIAMALFDSKAGVTMTSLVQSKKLKLLAVSTPVRQPQFPNTPTVSESGLPGFEFNSWFTLVAPAGTPKAIIDRLNAEIQKALKDPGVIEKFAAQGLTPRGTSPQELGTQTKAALTRYAELMKAAGVKPE
jgi:tripartite-type tricarboxylate transporter receptor subunit TctC